MPDPSFHPASERIQAFVQGDVNPFESEFIARHLDECPRCSELAAGMTASDPLMKLIERAASAPRITPASGCDDANGGM